MNILRTSNPNRRSRAESIMLAVALGAGTVSTASACTATSTGENPAVSTTQAPPAEPNPSCNITAKADAMVAHKEDFSVGVANGFQPGLFDVESSTARWDFGDSSVDTSGGQSYEPHTYKRAGTYSVSVSIPIDSSGAAGAPKPGSHVSCDTTVHIQ